MDGSRPHHRPNPTAKHYVMRWLCGLLWQQFTHFYHGRIGVIFKFILARRVTLKSKAAKGQCPKSDCVQFKWHGRLQLAV